MMDTNEYIRIAVKCIVGIMVMLMTRAYCCAQQSFSPGDAAPSMAGGVWLKGDPITQFERGYVYVLDFSSVLCSPCRAFIPHLTELAHRHAGRVIVAGVYVYENPEDDTISTLYQESVRRFVLRMEERMDYSVVVDGPTRSLARAWMQAGGYEGMPTTFVINGEGNMVWAGYPPGLESVLNHLLAGDFRIREGQELDRRRISADVRIFNAKKNKEYQTAINIVDSLIRVAPMDKHLYVEKFKILLVTDEASAYAYARWVAKGPCADAESVLYYMAREVVEHWSVLQRPDIRLAHHLADRAIRLSKSDAITAYLYDIKAQLYLLSGDMRKAVRAEKKAIKVVPLDTYPSMSNLWSIFNARVQIFQEYGRIQ